MPKVYVSSVIDASAERVWREVRDFASLPKWVPAVAECRIESNVPADQIGCVRAFKLKDGGMLREKLLALSDYDFSTTYSILESPMAVENYIATLRLVPVTDGERCFAEWTAEFDCDPTRAEALVDQIGRGVFQAAFDELKRRVARR
jgi:hypothetical protein